LALQQAHLAPFVAYPFALGDEDIAINMHHNMFSPSSSLLTMEQLHKEEMPNTAHTVAEEIQVRRLDGLAEELQLEDPVFVKLDVQGYTEPVLRGGEHVVRRARAVVAEVSVQPLYQGETTFDQAYKILTEWGFVYRGNVDQWSSERDGRILQCDCLFENTNHSTNIER
jgi:FkbM family methyltransferase